MDIELPIHSGHYTFTHELAHTLVSVTDREGYKVAYTCSKLTFILVGFRVVAMIVTVRIQTLGLETSTSVTSIQLAIDFER